jgi:SAM-dependent methyltransferase
VTDDQGTSHRYHLELAAAFVRGRLGRVRGECDEDAIARGLAGGLRLHKFKADVALPRVRRVLGLLRAFAPVTLLDVGSGRGTFLWPLLADTALPDVTVTAIDRDPRRATDLGAVARGGVPRLTAARADVVELPFRDGAFDATTALEVLEHLPDAAPERAAREALRVSRRALVVSVPSHEDDNPGHVQRFDARALEALLRRAGARSVAFEHVLNHTIAVARR